MQHWIWTLLSLVNFALVLFAIQYILRTRRDPRGMMSWILALLLAPGIGLAAFMLIGTVPIQRRVRRWRKRRRLIEPALRSRANALTQSHNALEQLDPGERGIIRVAGRMSEAMVTGGNEITVGHDAEQAFLNMGLAIQAAVSHIHMEYYIFADDETGRAMRDLLVSKARQGVEVRLLLDSVGSWKLRRAFIRSLRDGGVKVAWFLPWGLFGRRLHINCRNHRKMVIIDGREGYVDSKNIGDEYLGRRKELGPWRDTHMRIRGPAIVELQRIFAEDWHFAANEALTGPRYLPEPERVGTQLVQIVPSGPDRHPDIMHQLLYAAVSDAHKSVSIITPYFVPDPAMVLALGWAAYRGASVRLLVPSRSDHPLVLWAGRSSYEELLEAGVEIYEYGVGMLHSKVVTIDQRWAMIGSANMDVRSFRVNFEITNIIYDRGIAQQMSGEFDSLAALAKRVRREDLAAWTYGQQLFAGVARLATPLL